MKKRYPRGRVVLEADGGCFIDVADYTRLPATYFS
jgi:hypothetical protein